MLPNYVKSLGINHLIYHEVMIIKDMAKKGSSTSDLIISILAKAILTILGLCIERYVSYRLLKFHKN